MLYWAKRKKKSDTSAWYYLGLVGQMGFSVALPIAGGAIFGRYVDTHWWSYPKGTLTFLIMGVVLSAVSFIRIVLTVTEKK